MSPSTLHALQASIRHWEALAATTTADQIAIGPDKCGLCKEFWFTPERIDQCKGCPVFEKTGERFCGSSPFEKANSLWDSWDEDEEFPWKEWKEAAQEELDFLRSLLPPESQP